MKRIVIAKDYSEYPYGRFPDDSDFNGQRFREEFLVPALRSENEVTVNIDGAEGYGSSFLEEAFGGLVRKGYFTAKQLASKLKIESSNSDNAMYTRSIWNHINDASKE